MLALENVGKIMLMSYPGCLRIKVVSFIVGIISKIIVVTSEVCSGIMTPT